ncbi:IS110 family RNA-guided transposase [Salinispora fenicalii]|uniref:IS110 family transposase n=1 Tax=Salinispora fenicalii TaxID=1137263 RepID=UPI000489F4BF|nr:IS110 family transposase [Salinispora fenicalii]
MSSVLAERLADRVDAIIGVDTHTDTHTAAVVSPVGSVLAELTVTATTDGVASLLAWAGEHTNGLGSGRRAWALDSARSHGVGLLHALRTANETVFEAPKPTATARRRGGKSDSLDAVHSARAVLAADHTTTPRADGDREALRILHACRRHYTDTRTATVNLFKSLILTADDELRDQFRGRNTDQQVRLAADLTAGEDADTLARLRRDQMTALANHIRDLDRLLATNLRHIRDLVTAMCPPLLKQPGIGPVTAAVALISWSHHGRVRSEAAFAALAGVSPVPASSGRTVRHRLNRGGDRTLNSAIHTIAKSRQRYHQPTKDYITRRTTEGRTPREITRVLKRYIARQIWWIIQAAP